MIEDRIDGDMLNELVANAGPGLASCRRDNGVRRRFNLTSNSTSVTYASMALNFSGEK